MIVFDYTLWTIILAGAVTGLLSGVLGVFTLLRKQSLLGDTISHAALPGIAIAFLIMQTKVQLALILGAMAVGWLGALFISWVIKNSRVKQDAVMGVVLSGFFGFGLVLLSVIQNMPSANKAGLTKFLFGNAATVLRQDVVIMSVFAIISIIILITFWKEFKLATFDPDFMVSLGFPVKLLDVLLLSTVVIAITIGLQAIGVVLMSALLIAPAAAARQWTDRLGVMTFLAAFIGTVSSVIGAMISSIFDKMPTGPVTVLIVTIFVLISIFFAGKRGIVWKWFKRFRNRGELALSRLLEQIYVLSQHHADKSYFHETKLFQSVFHEKIDKYLHLLDRRGLIELSEDGKMVRLTKNGYSEAMKFATETKTGGAE